MFKNFPESKDLVVGNDEVAFYVNKTVGEVRVPLSGSAKITGLKEGDTRETAKIAVKKLSVAGTAHQIILGENVDARRVVVGFKGAGNKLIIGSNAVVRGTIAIQGRGLTVFIGSGTSFNNVEIFCKGDKNGVYIGRDCMFSSGIEIRTSDAHSVIDIDSMKKTNHPDGVFIGDHVWLAKNVFVQKGAAIGDDNVVGFGSMVRGDMRVTNSVLVGSPAKPVPDRNVTWSRKGSFRDKDVPEAYDWKKLPIF